MTIQQKIKDLESKIEALKSQEIESQIEALKSQEIESQIEALKSQEIVHPSSNLDKAPAICTLNGVKWLLGPEAEDELTWEDAVAWCKLNGGELPPREILFLASLNQDAADWFREQPYWSSTEFNATYAWVQSFRNGYTFYTSKPTSSYVRAVRKVLI